MLLTGCSGMGPDDGQGASKGRSSPGSGVSPGSVPSVAARAPRTPPATLPAPPGPGTVLVEAGPFTDRISLTGLTVRPGTRPRVTGQLTVTTDVSEVMALEVAADFYDAQGHFLGSAAQALQGHSIGGPEHDDAHGNPSESVAIDVGPGSPFQREASVAIVTVPQLVNE